MFKSLIFILGLSLSQSVYASSSEHKDHTKVEKPNRISLNEKDKKDVLQVLELNHALHSSFFTYVATEVEVKAKALSNKIDQIENKEIAKLLNYSKNKLLEIKRDKEREENNKSYHLVSMALIYIVNKYDVGSKYNAYSCPMVKKKWVQNSVKMSKVHNPYAPEMPHCGSQDSKH